MQGDPTVAETVPHFIEIGPISVGPVRTIFDQTSPLSPRMLQETNMTNMSTGLCEHTTGLRKMGRTSVRNSRCSPEGVA